MGWKVENHIQRRPNHAVWQLTVSRNDLVGAALITEEGKPSHPEPTVPPPRAPTQQDASHGRASWKQHLVLGGFNPEPVSCSPSFSGEGRPRLLGTEGWAGLGYSTLGRTTGMDSQ